MVSLKNGFWSETERRIVFLDMYNKRKSECKFASENWL